MFVKFFWQIVFYSALLTAGWWVTGCEKNERSIDEPRFTTLELKTYSTDTLQLKIQANEETLTDTLRSPEGIDFIAVQYFDPTHRIRLFDAFSGRLLLDTLINYKTGFINALTFFQSSPGGPFIWIGPPVNEPLPPADKLKIAISYTHAELPAEVKVVIENSGVVGPPAYKATDSFQLKKGEFSRYFQVPTMASRRPKLFLYTMDGQRKLVATVDEQSYPTTINADYNILLLRKHTSYSGGVYSIKPDKLY